jgi:uncharacterized protein
VTPGQAIILFLAGLAAGFVNTVAGGGSAISIPILVELVGGNVANGTNRVAILLANITATVSFSRGGAIDWKSVAKLVPPAVVGAALGAWAATGMSAEGMRSVFGLVLLVVAASVLIRPGRWVAEREARLSEPWRSLVFFAIGFYGGFVQVGVGFFLLAGLVLGGGLNLVTGNAAKVVIIAAYTAVALVIFAGAAQVDFLLGLVLAAGNSTGALISSRLALKKGAEWVRWFLIVAAVAAAIRMLLM